MGQCEKLVYAVLISAVWCEIYNVKSGIAFCIASILSLYLFKFGYWVCDKYETNACKAGISNTGILLFVSYLILWTASWSYTVAMLFNEVTKS